MGEVQTGKLIGINMKTGKLVHSDDPDIQVGDIITKSGLVIGDSATGQIVGGYPLTWTKIKNLGMIPMQEQVSFVQGCPICRVTVKGSNYNRLLRWHTQHRQGNHCSLASLN